MDLNIRLKRLRDEERRTFRENEEKKRRKRIQCEGCEGLHKIGGLHAIQTHTHFLPDYGSERSYWREGDLLFVCPETGVVNRLSFRDHDDPARKQFRTKYGHLFKDVENVYSERASSGVDNFYVDNHRRVFGLVGKRKGEEDI